MADEHFYGKPGAQQAYQPIGDLLLDFNMLEDTHLKDFTSEKAPEVYLSSTTTMNIGMVRDLFPHVIEAGKIFCLLYGISEDLNF